MPLKARDVIASLQSKFLFATGTKGKDPDHLWLVVTVPGAPKVAVMFSRGEKELGDRLLALVCKQVRVTRPYLNGMIQCANSQEAYYKKLVDDAKASG